MPGRACFALQNSLKRHTKRRLRKMGTKRDSRPNHAKRLIHILAVCFLTLLANPWTPLLKTEPARAADQESIFLPVALNGSILEDSPSPSPPPSYDGWLSYLNFYRSMSGLSPVAENKTWTEGSWYHSRYMVKNDHVEHGEDPANYWYTLEGDLAAQSSNLVASHNLAETDNYAIDSWMQAPFHALHILNPALKQVGFGSFREDDGGLEMGATLDVLRGLGELQSSPDYPILWPGNGATVPIGSHWSEYPNPLSSCAGYVSPAGLPILLQLGQGNIIPNVSAHSFTRDEMELEHCVFDETSYLNDDAAAQSLARSILNSRDAIVLIPRAPLAPGASYTVSITANGNTYTWTFDVAEGASTLDALSGSISVEFLIPEAGDSGSPSQ